jgi:hypothetical protein
MAIDAKYIDLINAEIDGEISAEDRARLDEYLAGNADARAFREGLMGLCVELDAVESVEPPAHLKHAVLDTITRQPSMKPAAVPGRWRLTFDMFFGGDAARYALSFAAGALLTYAFISSDQISREAFDDVTGLVGTISQPDSASEMSKVSDIRLNLSEVAGSVNLNRAGSILILDFDLASQQPIEIVADYDDRDIWFNGFAQLESEGTSVAAETGQVTVRMAGQRRYAVYLYNAGQSATRIGLRFYSAGTLIHEDELIFEDTN